MDDVFVKPADPKPTSDIKDNVALERVQSKDRLVVSITNLSTNNISYNRR